MRRLLLVPSALRTFGLSLLVGGAGLVANAISCGSTAPGAVMTVRTPATDALDPESDLARYIAESVRLGFLDRDTIAESAIDIFGGDSDYPGDAAVRDEVDRALRAHLTAQERWGRTDTDRLVAAFEALEQGGILARHHYGSTRTDGAYALGEEIAIARSRGREVRGYVYYTRQDAESLLDGQLYLAWGPMSPPGLPYRRARAEALKVADTIAAALEAQGLTVLRAGSPHETIVLLDLAWRARRQPVTGAPTLPSDEQLSWEEGDVRPERDEGAGPLAVTPEGEWLLPILYLGEYGSTRAQANLVGISRQPVGEHMDHPGPLPAEVPLDGVTSLDVVFRRIRPLHGRAMRFDLQAMTMSPLYGAWADLASRSWALVLVAANQEESTELRSQVESRTDQIGYPPIVVQAEGDGWTDEEVEAVRATLPYPVVRANVVTGEGVLETLREAVGHAVRGAVQRLEATADPSRRAVNAGERASEPPEQARRGDEGDARRRP